MLELIKNLSLIKLSLSYIQYYADKITIATEKRLSQTDTRLSVSDNNIKYIIHFWVGKIKKTICEIKCPCFCNEKSLQY